MTAKQRESTLSRRGAAGPAVARGRPGLRAWRGKLFSPTGSRIAVAAVMLALCPLATRAEPAQGEFRQKAVATNAHLDDGTERAKLTFELSDSVKAAAFSLLDPDRVVIDLPEIDFRVDPEVGGLNESMRRGRQAARKPARSAGLITSYRFGFFTIGKSRIVIDLSAPARVVRAESEKTADGKTWLVVELAKTDQAQFRRAALSAAEAATHVSAHAADMPPSAVQAKPATLPTLVIDAGHGGVDSGAMANGLIEKNLVFEFAKTLQAKLQATGRFKIVMTRDSDVFVPLAERVRIGREAQAQLFISIHADMLVESSAVSGATFYTVSDRASDAEAARTAEKENQADAAAGLERQDDANDVSDILFDLTRRETRAYSHVFARTLANYWKIAGRLNKNPQREAGFRVLKAPDVPSVLIELGYVSNEKDAASFNSADWRDKTSDKIVEAVESVFAARGTDTHAETEPGEPGPPTPPSSDVEKPAQRPDPGNLAGHVPDAQATISLRDDATENVTGKSQ